MASRLALTFASACAVAIAACSGRDDGRVPEGGPPAGAAATPAATEPPEPPEPPEPTNLGWIGGSCKAAADCSYEGGFCLDSAAGFPRGLCSQRCESTCPDREGPNVTQTFCVGDRERLGTCVSRCDFEKVPGNGCRKGYGCTRVSRMGDPDRVEEACMPLGADGRALPLNDLQPAVERAARAADLEDERMVLMDVTENRAPTVAAIRGMLPVYPASVIKVVVMAEAERQIEKGTLSRTKTLTITEEQDTCDSLPDGDTRPTLEAGDKATIDQLVDVMITRSDNTATNALIDDLDARTRPRS